MGGGRRPVLEQLILRLDGNLAYWVTIQATNQFQDFGVNPKRAKPTKFNSLNDFLKLETS